MDKLMRTMALLMSLLCIVPAARAQSVPAGDGSADAVQSVFHSAQCLVHAPDKVPARAPRLVALVELASRLAPGRPDVQRLRAGVLETQGKLAEAAEALASALKADPSDNATAVRWLRLSLASLDSAAERMALIQSVLARDDLGDPLKADACVRWAGILMGQGRREQARSAYRKALSLDPYNPEALGGKLALTDGPSPAETARTLLGALRGNPLDAANAWKLALLLQRLGLYHASLEFFEYLERLSQAPGRGVRLSGAFLSHYFNAMLDAGKVSEAIKKFDPIAAKHPDHADIQSLLLEAYRAVGDEDKAEALVKTMQQAYERKRVTAPRSAVLASELAWFYLVTLNRPNVALSYASKAQSQLVDDPILQRIIGASELLAEKDRQADGVEKLRGLLAGDMYAAVFLAEHYFAVGDATAGAEAIGVGASLNRGGPAFRRLSVLASKHGVKIPPAPGSEEVAALVRGFDRRTLEMGLTPEKFLTVDVRSARTGVLTGEAIHIEATLTNTGPIDLPLGSRGLVSAVLGLEVTADGLNRTTFAGVPMIIFPSPRYLRPGKSVTADVRIDVAALAAHLASNCLRDVKLIVAARLDPLQTNGELAGALASVKIAPVELTVYGLLSEEFLGRLGHAKPEQPKAAYELAVALLARHDLAKGDVPSRMRAARQTAALLMLAREIQVGRVQNAPGYDGALRMAALVVQMDKALADKSPAVRAEMLAALGQVSLDEALLARLGGVVQDPSYLVRFRMVELIGASGTPGSRTLVDLYAQDADPCVRKMAQAFVAE